MLKPRTPDNEDARLRILDALQILDTASEQSFDDLVQLASIICEVPIALVSIVGEDRQWFKARKGLEMKGSSRDVSFCGHAVGDDAALIVDDALADARFHDNPLVVNHPHIRFYAGMPLRTREGLAMGTLCVIDCQPRGLSDVQRDALERLARQASQLLEQRRLRLEMEAMIKDLKLLSGFIPICAYCRKIRGKDNAWVDLEVYLRDSSNAVATHGMCNVCFKEMTEAL